MKKSKLQSQYFLLFQCLFLLYPFLDVFSEQLRNASGVSFVEEKCVNYLKDYYLKLGSNNSFLKQYPNGCYYTTDLDSLLVDGHYTDISKCSQEYNNGYWLSVHDVKISESSEDKEDSQAESNTTPPPPPTPPNTETPLSSKTPENTESTGNDLSSFASFVNVAYSAVFDCRLSPSNPSNPQNFSTPVNAEICAYSQAKSDRIFSDILYLPNGSQYALFRLNSVVCWRCSHCGARNMRGFICISCSNSLSKAEVTERHAFDV